MKYVPGFHPRNLRVLARKNPTTLVVLYETDFKGKEYVHIREIFVGKNDEYAPTRNGVSFDLTDKGAAIEKLANIQVK